MTSLGQTVAAIKARRPRRAARTQAAGLTVVKGFGTNPGNLTMKIHVPARLSPAAGLVVVMHGCTQTAEDFAGPVGWIELADRFGFAVVAPEQARANNSNLCFNWYLPADIKRGGGEAESIAQMVSYALDHHDLDRDRVFVTGLSAGGAMTSVMLATYPDMFAGGAIVAGLPYGVARNLGEALAAMAMTGPPTSAHLVDHVLSNTDHRGPWPKVSVWHGQSDSLVRPAAGEAVADQWRQLHGARSSPRKARTPGGRDFAVWMSADGEPVVELHRIDGLGHGAAVKAEGSDGCGTPSFYTPEVGVSSSFEIALGWGLADGSGTASAPAAPDGPGIDRAAPFPPPPSAVGANGIEEVINRALRSAGLLK